MKRVIILLLGLALLIPVTSFSTELTAEQILQKASETYRNLKSFRLVEERKGTYVWDLTDLSETIPGALRLGESGVDRVLLDSNREITWVYRPRVDEYLEMAAAPLLQEVWASPVFGARPQAIAPAESRNALAQYSGLASEKRNAKLLGEKRLEIGGNEVDCYVVSFSLPVGSHKFWVDKARFIVWQDEDLEPPCANPLCNDEGSATTSRLNEVDLDPIPDKVFQFVPPKGAKRVDAFSDGTSSIGVMRVAELLGLPDQGYVGKRRPPDFALQNLEGSNVRLKELRGKLIVLDFWASWCRPCQKELSDVQKLYGELASKGVIFIGVDDEDADTVKNFVKANGYNFPMLLDSKQTVHQLYDVRWAPTTVVINRKGKIVARYVGAGGEAQLRRALKTAGLDTTNP